MLFRGTSAGGNLGTGKESEEGEQIAPHQIGSVGLPCILFV